MKDRYCKVCKRTRTADRFYASHPGRCKDCIKADSRRTYGRRRDDLRREYAANKEEQQADARLNYDANKVRILLQVRLRYRQGKTAKTIEDEAVIEELQEILTGRKKMATACGWCADSQHRLDPYYESNTNKVSWLCPRCLQEVKAEHRKKIVRRQRVKKKKPKLPRWLRHLLRR